MFIGFLPKLILRSALLHPLSVLNVSPIVARIRVLWWILQSVRNEEENEEIKNLMDCSTSKYYTCTY